MAIHAALTLLAAFALPKLMGIPDAAPDTGGGGNRTPPSVVVLKSGRVRAFQDVADAFQDNCRVHVQQLYMADGNSPPGPARERLQVAVQSARVLVAVGQPAIEVVSGMENLEEATPEELDVLDQWNRDPEKFRLACCVRVKGGAVSIRPPGH